MSAPDDRGGEADRLRSAGDTPSRIIAGPFNRVEGDLEITLDIEGGRVAEARVNSPLFRGFERILEGKDPRDALSIVPRICGICSVSQSTAAARALGAAMGLVPTEHGARAANLVLAAENSADHLLHFHAFFMPDFARPVYEGTPLHDRVLRRFRAQTGEAVRAAIAARTQLMHLMGILAGKWPHTLALQPGGVTRAPDARDRVRLIAILGAFRRFLEESLYADRLEAVAALDSSAALEAWRRQRPAEGDMRLFLDLVDRLELHGLGRGPGRCLSYGAYDGPEGPLYAAGVFACGRVAPLVLDAIAEDHSHAWLEGAEPAHPFAGTTFPDADKAGAYSWCKAPRLDGAAIEVGALARQLVDGQPLLRDMVARDGPDLRARVVARLVELARTTLAMESWARALDPRAPYCVQGQVPDAARAVGLTEAARGALGHWLRIEAGRIAGYQIVAPTTWNFSPRDRLGVPGPVEAALAGAPVRPGERTPVAVQHIVRSFDPCMVCTVH